MKKFTIIGNLKPISATSYILKRLPSYFFLIQQSFSIYLGDNFY